MRDGFVLGTTGLSWLKSTSYCAFVAFYISEFHIVFSVMAYTSFVCSDNGVMKLILVEIFCSDESVPVGSELCVNLENEPIDLRCINGDDDRLKVKLETHKKSSSTENGMKNGFVSMKQFSMEGRIGRLYGMNHCFISLSRSISHLKNVCMRYACRDANDRL